MTDTKGISCKKVKRIGSVVSKGRIRPKTLDDATEHLVGKLAGNPGKREFRFARKVHTYERRISLNTRLDPGVIDWLYKVSAHDGVPVSTVVDNCVGMVMRHFRWVRLDDMKDHHEVLETTEARKTKKVEAPSF